MFIRKSKINELIQKERQSERKQCEKEGSFALKKLEQQLVEENKKYTKELKERYKRIIAKKDKEIKNLTREIDKNYSKYQKIRKRENHLDELTFEFEDVVNSMTVKLHETLQPFYRTRAKIEHAKRSSDKNNEKVESIFKAVK